MAGLMSQYQEGDIVKSALVGSGNNFYGIIRHVCTKINKVDVAWGGGAISQHDPDELMPVFGDDDSMSNFSRRSIPATLIGKSKKAKGLIGKNNDKDYKFYTVVKDKIEGGWEYKDDAKDNIDEMKEEGIRGKILSITGLKSKGIDPNDDKNWTSGSRTAAGEDPEFVGDPKTHGLKEPRGGGFSIMQDLVGDLAEESIKESDKSRYPDGPSAIKSNDGLKSRRSMYYMGPERQFRLTKNEQSQGKTGCPKCSGDMDLQPFTRSIKLYVCSDCNLKVPTDKVLTERVPQETHTMPDGTEMPGATHEFEEMY
jgi:hypothetical protein